MNLETKVAKGAVLLDGIDPEWFDKIELEDLDMMECKFCILGQLYGDYESGLHEIGFHYDQKGHARRFDYGFSTSFSEGGSHRELTEPWKQEILNRRQKETERNINYEK